MVNRGGSSGSNSDRRITSASNYVSNAATVIEKIVKKLETSPQNVKKTDLDYRVFSLFAKARRVAFGVKNLHSNVGEREANDLKEALMELLSASVRGRLVDRRSNRVQQNVNNEILKTLICFVIGLIFMIVFMFFVNKLLVHANNEPIPPFLQGSIFIFILYKYIQVEKYTLDRVKQIIRHAFGFRSIPVTYTLNNMDSVRNVIEEIARYENKNVLVLHHDRNRRIEWNRQLENILKEILKESRLKKKFVYNVQYLPNRVRYRDNFYDRTPLLKELLIRSLVERRIMGANRETLRAATLAMASFDRSALTWFTDVSKSLNVSPEHMVALGMYILPSISVPFEWASGANKIDPVSLQNMSERGRGFVLGLSNINGEGKVRRLYNANTIRELQRHGYFTNPMNPAERITKNSIVGVRSKNRKNSNF
jgi:hypothetical protein